MEVKNKQINYNKMLNINSSAFSFMKNTYLNHGVHETSILKDSENYGKYNLLKNSGYIEWTGTANNRVFYKLTTKAKVMISCIENNKLNYNIGHTSLKKEKDLEDILANDLGIIEEGLTFIGRQVTVDGGFIDILARDKNSVLTIIELKVKEDDERLLFQSAYYPTQFDEKVRMIAIAPNYSHKVHTALESLTDIEIKRYKIENWQVHVEDYKLKYIVQNISREEWEGSYFSTGETFGGGLINWSTTPNRAKIFKSKVEAQSLVDELISKTRYNQNNFRIITQ